MNTTTWTLVAATLLFALLDWIAVARENQRMEWVFKPLTMLPLIGAAVALDPAVASMRPWFVAALVFSLAGDVFLMLPDDRFFVPGLGSFLVGHVLYVIGLIDGGVSGGNLIVGGVLTFTLLVAVGPTLIKGAHELDRMLAAPVAIYMLTISVMVTCAIGAGVWPGIVGALLFFLSDFMIGWSKFVADFPRAHLGIMITYHLAQVMLVVSLASAH